MTVDFPAQVEALLQQYEARQTFLGLRMESPDLHALDVFLARKRDLQERRTVLNRTLIEWGFGELRDFSSTELEMHEKATRDLARDADGLDRKSVV